MTIAQRLTRRMQAEGRRRTKQSIYAIVSDDRNVHCLTEAHLDVWWNSLDPEDKAEAYELHLGPPEPTRISYEDLCAHCGQSRGGHLVSALIDHAFVEQDKTLAWAESRMRGYVPYSPADVCFCQPFAGPIHPRCPMHCARAIAPLTEVAHATGL